MSITGRKSKTQFSLQAIIIWVTIFAVLLSVFQYERNAIVLFRGFFGGDAFLYYPTSLLPVWQRVALTVAVVSVTYVVSAAVIQIGTYLSYKRVVALFVLCVGFTPTVAAAEPKHGEFASEKLTVGDATRVYRLVVPKSVDLKTPAPLVFAFHGMLIDSKDFMPRYTKLNETAEKNQFIITYPDAVGRSWGLTAEKVKSDLAFFDDLLKKLSTDYKIDPDRVYVLGMSNGGYLAHLVGKERSKTIAAVACHSGSLGLQTLLGIKAERKFPVLIIHGDQDSIIPVAWARENRDKYKREGHEVKYVEVPGLNHIWATSVDVNATIWKFFSEHPR